MRILVDDRQGQMRVERGGAVPREMFHAGGDAGPLQAFDPGCRLPRHETGLCTERTHADDWIDRVAVDVGHRREVEVDAGGGQFRADGARDRACELEVVDRAQGEVAGVRAASGRLQASDIPPFLIDRDDEAGVLDMQPFGHCSQLGSRAHVARVQADAAKTGGCAPQDPVRRLGADEAGQQAAVRESFDGIHRHPLTAPAVRLPWT